MKISKKSQRQIQLSCFKFLEHPKGTFHIVYHLAIFAFVLLTLCLSALLNLDQDKNSGSKVLQRVLFSMEVTLAVYFTLELCVRIWACGCKAKYQGVKGRIVYLSQFICVIDLLIVISTVFLLLFGTKDGRFLGLSTVQNFRFLQILRLLHVDRSATTWKMMEKILKIHKTELFAAYYLMFLGLMVLSCFVYLTESYHDDDKYGPETPDNPSEGRTFHGFGDAVWWGIITVMSVGYGDFVPKFWASKLVTVIFGLISISLFTLVSSVIGVGLSLMVQDNERRKQQNKQAPHAARVIQNFYRMRLLATKYDDIGYYKNNLTQKLIADELRSQLTKHLGADHHLVHREMHRNLSVHGMLEAVKKMGTNIGHVHIGHHQNRHKSRHISGDRRPSGKRKSSGGQKSGSSTPPGRMPHVASEPYIHRPLVDQRSLSIHTLPTTSDSAYNSAENSPGPAHLSDVEAGSVFYTLPGSETTVHFKSRESGDHSWSSSTNLALDLDADADIPKRYRLGLVAVWKFKFLAAKNRFKAARRPYELLDISQEVTESEHAQISKLKDVHLHVEHVIGRPQLSLLTKNQQKLGLVQRLQLVEQKMAQLDRKADLVLQLATQIGEQIIIQRQEQKRLLEEKEREKNFCLECTCRKIRAESNLLPVNNTFQ